MTRMFEYHNAITTDELTNWDTSRVITMEKMFHRAPNYKGRGLNYWDTSKVTTFYGMFWFTLFDGEISNWDVSSLTNVKHMFRGCNRYGASIDVSKWNTINLESVESFVGFGGINPDMSGWDTSKVTTIKDLAYKNNYFKPELGQWDTSRITNTQNAFAYAKGFVSDLSGYVDIIKLYIYIYVYIYSFL